ncbi:hypothetical protein ACFV5E_34370 [Streptomyces chartreusis]|uniref:hypothetical protein n=1 Tax=Streptomyces chartreusis TaxID=1969 RepID=UPI00368EED91
MASSTSWAMSLPTVRTAYYTGHQPTTAFGNAFLTDRTVFSLLDTHRQLRAGAFEDGRLDLGVCVLAPLLRPAGPDHVAFVHTAYQELLAARMLAEPVNRYLAGDLPGGAFLASMPSTPETDDCVLPAGAYLVGPAERLLIRRVERPVRLYASTATP